MTDESEEEPEAEKEPKSEEEPEVIAEDEESEAEWVIIKDYRNNALYVRVQGAIVNPITHRRAPFSFECMIDTGFFSGLYYEATLRSDAETVDVVSHPTTIHLADGTPVAAHTCIAYIEKINDYTLPPPGIPVTLYMRGTRRGFIGMEALKSFIILLDGQKQELKIRL